MVKSIRNLSSVTVVGLDIAKNVFQVHGVDAAGADVVAKAVRRGQLVKVLFVVAAVLDRDRGLQFGASLGAVADRARRNYGNYGASAFNCQMPAGRSSAWIRGSSPVIRVTVHLIELRVVTGDGVDANYGDTITHNYGDSAFNYQMSAGRSLAWIRGSSPRMTTFEGVANSGTPP